MRNVDWIVIHCTGAAANQSVASIERHWREVRGWRNPGYHRMIMPDGSVHVFAGDDQICNGVAGYNSNAIHVCYTGGVDSFGRISDTRTQAQRATLAAQVQELHEKYPAAMILGHRDFSPDKNRNGIIEPHEWIKACPSFSVKAWLKEIGFKSQADLQLSQTSVRVNIRSGPGVSHPTVGPALAQDTLVKIISSCGDWRYVKVTATKQLGWVAAQYLEGQS